MTKVHLWQSTFDLQKKDKNWAGITIYFDVSLKLVLSRWITQDKFIFAETPISWKIVEVQKNCFY